MTDPVDATQLRRWLWVLRSSLVAAGVAGVVTLAVIQTTDPSVSSAFVLVAVVSAVAFGGLIGNIAAGIVLGHAERPIRRPRSMASFLLILALTGLLGLLVSLLVARLGIHPRYPTATLVAIAPLLALIANEIVDGLMGRAAH